jgi:hypothetical protein
MSKAALEGERKQVTVLFADLAYAACTAGDYRAATGFCRRMIDLLQGEMGRERMGPNFPAVPSAGHATLAGHGRGGDARASVARSRIHGVRRPAHGAPPEEGD